MFTIYRRKHVPFAIERIIEEQTEALALIGCRMSHEEFVLHCVGTMPRHKSRKRDLRRRTIERALLNMHNRGRLPMEVDGEFFVF
jgi:hypothetical protein